MVEELIKGDKTFYACEECGLAYEEREQAERCEAWCREYHSSNLEIIRQAVPLE
ncbi:MAG: hypothetical protein Q8Q07_01740 [Dehalococcoidales bacterium]|nr:hypothetical protein [Dehalococcoidales bacterium]